MHHQITFRYEVSPDDRQIVRDIVASTGFFSPVEVEVAVELVDERLAEGPASGYHFVFAERGGQVLGYACYGPIALTAASYDLFWIAVDQAFQGQKIGKILLEKSEQLIRRRADGRCISKHRTAASTLRPADFTSVAATAKRPCSKISTTAATTR